MKKLSKIIAFTIGLLLSGSILAQKTPNWEPLKDEDGDIVKVDRAGTKVEIDRTNTIGWGTQKMRVFYRVKFLKPIQATPAGQMVDEEHFELDIRCSNVFKAHMLKKHWYLDGRHTNIFTYGDKGRKVSTLVTENTPVFYILQSGCPEFDQAYQEDSYEMDFLGGSSIKK